MIDFKNIEGIYFVGIGGIGMSALALYFAKGGYTIAGYDRSKNSITDALATEGCTVAFKDDISVMPSLFKDIKRKNKVIVIYTPAIPDESRILSYFRNNGYSMHKRAEILGDDLFRDRYNCSGRDTWENDNFHNDRSSPETIACRLFSIPWWYFQEL